MKQVSEIYRESMARPFRNRSYVRALFTNNDTSIPSDGQWESNGELSISNTDTLDYDRMYGDPYATLELNRWVLDGAFDIAPETGAVTGFVSSQLSDINGSANAVLTRNFSMQHTIPNMTLSFDTRTGIHPNSVTVSFYLGGGEVNTFTVPVTGDSVSIATDIAACDSITVTFGNMPPYRFPRLEGITYGVQKIFTSKDIVSSTQMHDIDPLSRRLPKETLQFAILDYDRKYDPDNPTGVWKFIAEKSIVDLQIGHELPNGLTEWVKADRYTMDSRPSFANNMATFRATGAIGQMTGTYYKGVFRRQSFYDLAEDVLIDAELPPRPDGSNPWVIDDSLRDMYTDAPMPIDTHANCLQMIAHACRCTLRTDDNNVLHIEPCLITPDSGMTAFTIDFSTIAQNSQTLTKIDQLKAVRVAQYTYTPGITETLYSVKTDEPELHIELSEPAANINISVSSGSIISQHVYANAVDLELSVGTKTVVITGDPVSKQSTLYTLPVSGMGSVDEEQNPLITDIDMTKALAIHVASYLQMRNTYDVAYRGNPELECGDIIGMQTAHTPLIKGVILTDEISFNGILRGKVKVKALSAAPIVFDVLDNFILDQSSLS